VIINILRVAKQFKENMPREDDCNLSGKLADELIKSGLDGIPADLKRNITPSMGALKPLIKSSIRGVNTAYMVVCVNKVLYLGVKK